MRVTQAERARTRQALIRAGLGLFAAQGFAATTVDQVAAAAGVAKGTLYNYFPSKEDVALAGLVAALEDVRADLGCIIALPAFAERLQAVFERLGQASGGNRELIWLWTVENLRRGRSEAASARLGDILGHLCADAQARGELRADRPAAAMALDFLGLVLAHIGRWYHAGEAAGLDDELRQAFAAYLDGARRGVAGGASAPPAPEQSSARP